MHKHVDGFHYTNLAVYLCVRPTTAIAATANATDSAVIMSTNLAQPATNAASIDDTPYTSSLLRYDTQLKQTSTLLSTMRDVVPYVTVIQRFQLNALIQVTDSLHATASKELEDLLKRAELFIQYEFDKPGRIFDTESSRDKLEEGFAALSRLIDKLVLKVDKLEAMRVQLLQLWNVKDLSA